MPRKPRKTKREKRQLAPWELAYLSDGDASLEDLQDFQLWCYRHGMPGFDGTPHPRELWEKHKDDFLPEFIKANPGRRPLPFWQWDAPRQDTGTGAYFEPLPILRLRIGGKGQTTKEKYPAVVPESKKGIPSSWAAVDPNDPPIYESEAAYLKRHKLLSKEEKAYLKIHQELLELEKVTFDD